MPQFDPLILGDHVCWVIDDHAVRLESLTALVGAGLQEGHRVVYCGDDRGEVLTAFGRRGLDTGKALASGQLRAPPVESTYLTAGAFDPAAALAFLRRQIDDASRAGYPGLRMVTDMSWARRPVPGIERLSEYEIQVNTIFAEGYALGVCAYSPRVFGETAVRGFARAHLGSVRAGRPVDPAALLRAQRTHQPEGVRLDGEADLFNQQALSAILEQLTGSRSGQAATVTVDLSGLSFIDTAAARALLQAADSAGDRLRFIGHPATFTRLLELHRAPLPAGFA